MDCTSGFAGRPSGLRFQCCGRRAHEARHRAKGMTVGIRRTHPFGTPRRSAAVSQTHAARARDALRCGTTLDMAREGRPARPGRRGVPVAHPSAEGESEYWPAGTARVQHQRGHLRRRAALRARHRRQEIRARLRGQDIHWARPPAVDLARHADDRQASPHRRRDGPDEYSAIADNKRLNQLMGSGTCAARWTCSQAHKGEGSPR